MSEAHASATWVDLCENPKAVSFHFSSAPTLERFLVTTLDVGHYAPSEPPSLHLHGIVSQKPDRFHLLPGQPEPDSVSLSLAFYKVSNLSLEGFRGEGIGSVRIRKATNGQIEFEF